MNAHRYRTLVRVISFTTEGVWCVFPAWDHKTAILLDASIFAQPVAEGYRFHAEVALNAESPKDLNPTNFEFPAVVSG